MKKEMSAKAFYKMFVAEHRDVLDAMAVDTTGTIVAPWTKEQVRDLNNRQKDERLHPYTCGNDKCRRKHREGLQATKDGWICRFCSYRQKWAHSIDARPYHKQRKE